MRTEDLKLIHDVGLLARKDIEKTFPECLPYLRGTCAIASHHLMVLLGMYGIYPAFCIGNGHCWLKWPEHDLLIDITATQFANVEKVFFLSQEDSQMYSWYAVLYRLESTPQASLSFIREFCFYDEQKIEKLQKIQKEFYNNA